MSHEISSTAYVGETPWHALGSRLPPKQSIEVWAQTAGMDWTLCEAPVRFQPGKSADSSILAFDDKKVLYRSDNHQALSVVSKKYVQVQPKAVLEFYRDLVQVSGYELETAGCLRGGRKIWALAKTGKQTVLRGGDRVDGYILLATSCDGSLATTATHTTVRVVCANTLAVAINNSRGAVRVPHNTVFDPDIVKSRLGIAVSQWDQFMDRMKALSQRKVNNAEAETFLRKLLHLPQLPDLPQMSVNANAQASHGRSLKKILDLFNGQGRGAELSAAKGTAWGVLNSVTEFVDHERRAKSPDLRMDSAWFGLGAQIKDRALSQALELVN